MPVDERGRAEIAVGINPAAILDMDDVVGIRRPILRNCSTVVGS
jgi:hypothetical protein